MKKSSLTIQEVLTKQVAEILPNRKGLAGLMQKKKIRLYFGVDPTGKYLHLGHVIPLRKLQQFADLGHEAILVVGTGTVLTGDPSQRKDVRSPITQKEITEYLNAWKEQASKVLDFSKIKIRFNGDWLLKLRLPEIITIASHISAAQLFQRDMFQARLQKGGVVWTHELLYPLLQGYDSVEMDVDLEIGGTDQLFNMLIGRELQKKMQNREKYVLCTPMLLGLDGKQMSKTSKNTVNILDTPQEMYGKLMSMRDELIPHYFELCCEVPLSEVKRLSPRDAKARLAKEIVSLYHSKQAAEKAEKEFQRVFQERRTPSYIPKLTVRQSTLNLEELVLRAGFANSKSAAQRLIKQGGIKVDGVMVKDPGLAISLQKGMVVQAGKRRFVKIA